MIVPRRALITGGAGFIGSHLVDALLARGYVVTVLDDLSTGSLDNLVAHRDDSRLEVIIGSVLDEMLVDELVRRCDVIAHLAAAVGVQQVMANPLSALRTNIRGAEVVLERADRHRRKTLLASSSEIYGKGGDVPFAEDDDRLLGSPLSLRWSYATSKAVDEILAHGYWRHNGLPTVIARLFNTVGPRQSGSYGMVVPRFIDAALAGEPLRLHGTGQQTRCFCHVLDVVEALIGLLEHPGAVGSVFNVGSQEEISMNDLARKVLAMTGSRSHRIHVAYDDAFGPQGFEDLPRRVPNTSRIERLLGWRASRNLDTTIRNTIVSRQSLLASTGTAGWR